MTKAKTFKLSPRAPGSATRADIVRLFGELDDESVTAVLALTPTVAEAEEASVWLEGRGDEIARKGHHQTPRIATILEIVDRNEDDEPSYLR